MKPFFLIGFRGAGKTTLGKKIAERKGISFLDLDEKFETLKKVSILDFIQIHGVERFRREEEKILEETIQKIFAQDKPVVVATGGGFVDWTPSVEKLKNCEAKKIYLNPSAKQLWERIQAKPERKAIGNLQDFSSLLGLWEKRDPLFRQIATHIISEADISLALQKLEEVLRS